MSVAAAARFHFVVMGIPSLIRLELSPSLSEQQRSPPAGGCNITLSSVAYHPHEAVAQHLRRSQSRRRSSLRCHIFHFGGSGVARKSHTLSPSRPAAAAGANCLSSTTQRTTPLRSLPCYNHLDVISLRHRAGWPALNWHKLNICVCVCELSVDRETLRRLRSTAKDTDSD